MWPAGNIKKLVVITTATAIFHPSWLFAIISGLKYDNINATHLH